MRSRLIARLFAAARGPACACAAQEQHHADAGGEDHRRLAEGVIAAVVGQNRGHDVRNIGFLDRIGDVARHDVLVDHGVGGAEGRQNERAPDQHRAGPERDEQGQDRWGRIGRISVVLIRCRVASRSTVEMPAPTEASVMATSTASSTINTLAIRKL